MNELVHNYARKAKTFHITLDTILILPWPSSRSTLWLRKRPTSSLPIT